MGHIEFFLEARVEENKVYGFSQGYMTVLGDFGSISSQPRYSMMILPSVSDLLDQTRMLLTDSKDGKSFEFIGIGCSFGFYVYLNNDNILVLSRAHDKIAEVEVNVYIKALLTAVNIFLANYEDLFVLDDNEEYVAFQDLYNSIGKFHNCLDL